MPRNVRNAWISADISRRQTALEGGPASKDGYLYARIFYREKGAISPDTIQITVQPDGDGDLAIRIYAAGDLVYSKNVQR